MSEVEVPLKTTTPKEEETKENRVDEKLVEKTVKVFFLLIITLLST